ncbi:hypothetical protein NEF87_000059 [Candidatus Lokiarchaeum ossiferum]|uniref:Uncharacterized protein n=1 Tax=Candidatus Lokiarchaeum ossiferum TaxID=2951803 RepID=A0ABY6HMH0_9ARCH|nr:hypothetical protein NEF87_000059 [Candidatus Lokiarchaeum sp. B-35]
MLPTNVENLLNTLSVYIAKILLILIPFMGIVLPIVTAFGKVIRAYVEPFYEFLPQNPNFFQFNTNWIYVILGGLILICGLVVNLVWPERSKRKNSK